MKQIFYKNIIISYTDSGKGTTVVLLHGFLENQKMWNELVAILSIKNRVITIDLLGHGATECLGYLHSMENNAKMVQAVLSHLHIRKAIFIGHSMGGYVALAFAEMFPEKMKGLVLLNSTSEADSEERKINRDRAIRAVKKDHTIFVRLSIANLFSPESREFLSDEIETVKFEALKTPLQGIVASLEGMKIRKDRGALLHQNLYPKLLILGINDPVLNYVVAVQQINNTSTQLESFNSGHMTLLENKDQLVTILKRFIKGI